MAIEINEEVLVNQIRALEAASMVDTELGGRLRQFISDELKAARKRIISSIHFKNGDPRAAAQSIRTTVYKKILGGNVNITKDKPTGNRSSYEAPRKLRAGQRGGNRMLRSQRTDDIMHYGPIDRAFILRFVNNGTRPRYSNGRNGTWKNGNNKTFFKLQEEGDYYRGSISPRNFFGPSAEKELQVALDNLVKMIDQEFDKVFKN